MPLFCYIDTCSTVPLLPKPEIFCKPLAIFCGCSAWFVSDLVRNPKGRFSHDQAYMFSVIQWIVNTSTIFEDLLQNLLANQSQSSCGTSMRSGNKSSYMYCEGSWPRCLPNSYMVETFKTNLQKREWDFERALSFEASNSTNVLYMYK